MSSETELKLWLRQDDAAAFAALPRLARARPERHRLRTIYFDTPEFDLAGRGIALRVRRVGRRWLQTLKTEGEKSGGLSTRLELETPVTGPMPNLSRLPADLVDGLVRKKWRARLVPVFETRFRRTVWKLRPSGGSRVEVALDVGEIVAGKKSEPLCEVELELGSGAIDALHALAQDFARHLLLIPCDASKAERGFRLANGRPRAAVSARLPSLMQDMPAPLAFAAIARACLAQFEANLPGLLQEDDPEYLHQARVALRRLRSAVRLFKKTCAPPAGEMARLAELARALGEARDWDVFVLETLPALLGAAPGGQGTLLERRARAARRKAREAALERLGQPQTGADLLALHRWLFRLENHPPQPAPELGRLAARRLARLHAAVLAAAEGFAGQTPDARHALRIRVKRLRYALDYFAALFGGRNKFARRFAALQDELGAMNDDAVALRLLSALDADGRLDPLVSELAGSLNARLDGRIGEIGATLEKFLRLAPPWQRG